jgi:membrane-associated phospholipid phosphatase
MNEKSSEAQETDKVSDVFAVMMMMMKQQQGRGVPPPLSDNHNDYNGEGGDDDNDNGNHDGASSIEIMAPLVPLAATARAGGGGGSFFQRSMSSNSSIGMNHPTPPASLGGGGGLPVRLQSSPENKHNTGGRLEQFLCWIICCCSSSTTAVAAIPEEIILLLQAIAALCFCLLGWYIPRYLIQRASVDILQKTDSIPIQTTVAGDVILDSLLNQPYVEPPTIPSQLLLFTSIWLPLTLVLVTAVAWSSSSNSTNSNAALAAANNNRIRRVLVLLHNVQAGFGGFCTAIGLSEGLTQMLKLYIQRKRPNFYALCDFDTVQKICQAEPKRILEANFSCPSGHSSLAACGMTFLALHVVAKIISLPSSSSSTLTPGRNCSLSGCVDSCGSMLTATVSQRKQCSSLLVVMVTSSWAMFVGASRIVDQWHHPSDVVAGLILGCF